MIIDPVFRGSIIDPVFQDRCPHRSIEEERHAIPGSYRQDKEVNSSCE